MQTESSTEHLQAIARRLRQLEDREEIRQLLMNYGRFLDQRDFAAFSELFAKESGEWIGGMGRARGARNIRQLMEDTIGRNTLDIDPNNFHIFTNETILIDGDQANATSKWMFIVQSKAGRPHLFFLGHYEDNLVRENGRWKFLRRIVYSDIPPA